MRAQRPQIELAQPGAKCKFETAQIMYGHVDENDYLFLNLLICINGEFL